MRPETKLTTHFPPAVVKRLSTTDIDHSQNWRIHIFEDRSGMAYHLNENEAQLLPCSCAFPAMRILTLRAKIIRILPVLYLILIHLI